MTTLAERIDEATEAEAPSTAEELISDVIGQLQGRLARMVDNAPGEGPTGAEAYIAWLAPEGIPTDDGRFMEPGSLRWREGRLPLMASDRNMPAHLNASFVGNLIDFTRTPDAAGIIWVTATVDWDSDTEAQEWKRMVDEDRIRGVSIDLAVQKARTRDDEAIVDEDDDETLAAEEWPEGVWLKVEDGIIVGATVVPMPAFAEARVEPEAVAAAEGDKIPADWFQIPEFARPTRARRQPNGKTAGHGAAWGVCHKGRHDVCTTAPHSETNYALGARAVADVPGGAIPVYWSPAGDAYAHAPLDLPFWQAIGWYEANCELIGFLKTAEDGHGIPTAGYTGPEMENRHLSGDWRPYPAPAPGSPAGGYEMIAWSAVDRPGFPVTPGAITAAVEVGRAIVGSAEPSECDCHAGAPEESLDGPELEERETDTERLTAALWALTAALTETLSEARLEYNRWQAQKSAGFQVNRIPDEPE